MADPSDVRVVDVKAAFRHSAGKLGTKFFAALRDDKKLLGWRTGTPARVMIPPKDLGMSGEWIEVGPGATLEAYAPNEWLQDIARPVEDGSCLALVRVDGADTSLLARVRTSGALKAGQRLVSHFAEERKGTMNDFWFEPAA